MTIERCPNPQGCDFLTGQAEPLIRANLGDIHAE